MGGGGRGGEGGVIFVATWEEEEKVVVEVCREDLVGLRERRWRKVWEEEEVRSKFCRDIVVVGHDEGEEGGGGGGEGSHEGFDVCL